MCVSEIRTKTFGGAIYEIRNAYSFETELVNYHLSIETSFYNFYICSLILGKFYYFSNIFFWSKGQNNFQSY